MVSRISRSQFNSKFRSLLRPLAAAAGCGVAVTLAVPAANAAPVAVVVQGQKIQTASGQVCTVGYVEGDRAWTAAHCGVNGSALYNEAGVHIGALRYLRAGGAPDYDMAYIQFAHGVAAGGNPETGDGMSAAPGLGGEVCADGRVTGVNCGKVASDGAAVNGAFATTDMFKNHGDSGAPVFVPGRPGVVGLLSGTFQRTGANGGTWSLVSYMPSAQERNNLEFQGRVARKGNISTAAALPLPAWLMAQLRGYVEQAEGLVSTSSRGPRLEDITGLLRYYGVA